jgi:hypothetical protein
MPDDVIDRVNQLGRRQDMPTLLSFADHFGQAIIDNEDDVDDDHDSDYDSDDASNGNDDALDPDDYNDDNSDADSLNRADSNDAGNNLENGNVHDLPVAPTGVDDAQGDLDEDGSDEEDDNEGPPMLQQPEPDDDTDPDDSDDEDNRDDDDDDIGTAGVTDTTETEDEAPTPEDTNKEEAAQETTANERYNLRPDCRQRNYSHMYNFNNSEDILAAFEEPMGELFMTEQMSLKRGLKEFGKDGANAVISKLKQLDYLDAIKPVHSKKVTGEQKKASLPYLMYLKQKRCGRVKARDCADGQKQRIYKTKEDTSSPTVSIDALFLTSIIDAKEGRDVATVDIPGAFSAL